MSERLTDEQIKEMFADHRTVHLFDSATVVAEIQALRTERDRALGQSEVLIQNMLPRMEALESGNKRDLDLARKTAALEALKLVSEAVRIYWDLFKNGSDTQAGIYSLVRADAALNLENQIIQHFQLPPTARIEVDSPERPVPPNLLENGKGA